MNNKNIFSELKHIIDPETEKARRVKNKTLTYEDVKKAQFDQKKTINSPPSPTAPSDSSGTGDEYIPEWGFYSQNTNNADQKKEEQNLKDDDSLENTLISPIDPDELCERLKQILSIENAIEVAAEHQKALSLRSGVPKENILKVQDLLIKLINESKRRSLILYDMIERLNSVHMEKCDND